MDSAIIQATYALDAAAEVAEKTNDSRSLLEIADVWMRLAEALGTTEQPVETWKATRISSFGFVPNAIEAKDEN